MRFRALIVLVLIAITLSICEADVHSWGERSVYYNHHMYDRTLIDEKNSVPKDYTIFYKYYGAHFKPVAYIEIDVNTDSTGYIHMDRGTQESYYGRRDTMQTFDARVDIKSVLNVTAKLKILGSGMIPLPNMGLGKLSATKSIAYVHVKQSSRSTQEKSKIATTSISAKKLLTVTEIFVHKTQEKFAQNSIGTRRTGDKLIHFKSKNVTNYNRFPSRTFEYAGEDYITYVSFSFNSPTAMVMVNTTFVGEQDFNAVVYDMKREHFVANISIYGIESRFRPDKFLGVI